MVRWVWGAHRKYTIFLPIKINLDMFLYQWISMLFGVHTKHTKTIDVHQNWWVTFLDCLQFCILSKKTQCWNIDDGEQNINSIFHSLYIGIYITFVGNAESVWSENSGDKRIAYRGKECYLSNRSYFIGEEDGNLNTVRINHLIKLKYACFFLMFRWINNTEARCVRIQLFMSTTGWFTIIVRGNLWTYSI